MTPTSVDCADSTTATSRVNGSWYASSVFGSGRAAASRANSSWISAFFSLVRAMAALVGNARTGVKPARVYPAGGRAISCGVMSMRDAPADEHIGPRPAPGQEGVAARAHPDDDDVVFDAILTPHRSLSKRGFTLLMTGVCVVSFTAGLGFFLIGAWPVVGFMGLDVLLIYGAFKLNFRAARLYETVTLTRDDLTVRRVSPRGDSQIWRFQPAWLQVRDGRPAQARQPAHPALARPPARDRQLPDFRGTPGSGQNAAGRPRQGDRARTADRGVNIWLLHVGETFARRAHAPVMDASRRGPSGPLLSMKFS
ncbi:MAG: DUF2244 domain-containing protein [Rhodovibrio sp.]|nr:DUF2244 domain-containing protein [Rhodovibrio sp.]